MKKISYLFEVTRKATAPKPATFEDKEDVSVIT